MISSSSPRSVLLQVDVDGPIEVGNSFGYLVPR